jgi:hypothetical protein
VRAGGAGPAEAEALWAALAGADAARAHQAVASLAAAPEVALSLLQGRLRPAPPPDVARIRRLIGDLDATKFSVRDAALRALGELREEAGPLVREALARQPSLEVRRRLQSLLAGGQVVRSPERLRELRAADVLERIGSGGARRLLEALAGGAPEARLTREARASLGRLSRRPPAPP